MKRIRISMYAVCILLLLLSGCSKDDNPLGGNVPLYYVTATVTNPAGQPQGGAILKLKGKDDTDPVFATITDSLGKGTIQTPEGAQTLVAKIGSVFLKEISVNVAASTTPTDAGTIQLTQSTTLKVLVIYAGCENLEEVLRDPRIGFTTFDSSYVDSMRILADADSNALLARLQQYTLIFSDCNCGDEYGYPLLARVYARYVQGGGKIYGGHYNYMNLQHIYPGYYQNENYDSNDSLTVLDTGFGNYVGFTVVPWMSSMGYSHYIDVPSSSKIYVTITGTSPAVPVVIENYLGSGKYLYTIYHNQDVIYDSSADPRLIKIVQYFLYSL